ncbi:hypothetical protein DOY81_007751, partial [Sarcophaga bullata]
YGLLVLAIKFKAANTAILKTPAPAPII